MRAHRTVSRSSDHLRVLSLLTLLIGVLAAVLLPASAASADVDDFDYSSWDATYEISLDDEGRSVARVTETLVAEFPDHDQNKGIVRGYPKRFAGSGLSIRILSVKDAAGKAVPFETESEDGALFVLTGTDAYVHGSQTYVIEYEMRDLMPHGTESENDEFMWNLLPTDSTQDVSRFHADLVFSPELAEALTGDTACYLGEYGATAQCALPAPAPVDGGAAFTVDAEEIPAGTTITVAIGFRAGTVTQPPARQPDPTADWGAPVIGLGSVLASVGTFFAVTGHQRRRRKATGVVVAQFDVPADMPPLVATNLLPKKPNPVPAQFVHLAVNGALRLEENETAGRKRPVLRLVDRSAARHALDESMMTALFGKDLTTREIPKSSQKFAKAMTKQVNAAEREAHRRGWLTKERSPLAVVLGIVSIVLFAGTVGFLIYVASQDRDSVGPATIAMILAMIGVIVGSIAAFMKHEVMTPAGAERYEYLQGVHEFIRVAETDRLRMLQSYTGAERRRDGVVDVVHLYEKLLPYAMLLGEEKSWGKVLETQYEQTGSPAWIYTAGSYHVSSHISQFSAEASSAANYSPPSSSGGFSGGSTGGGFAGGGGGGGFSGGR